MNESTGTAIDEQIEAEKRPGLRLSRNDMARMLLAEAIETREVSATLIPARDNPHRVSEVEDDIKPQHLHDAFVLRADQATRMASYTGPVTDNVLMHARRCAEAWTKLANDIEQRPRARKSSKK